MRPARGGLLPAALAAMVAAAAAAGAAERTLVIGTAPVAGVYFPAGGAVCNLVNRERARHGLRCLVESTGGSADNLERLRRGEIDFALVQSDWQYVAVREGQGPDGEPFEALRAVFSLHGQAVTVVAGRDSGIERLEDLRGRRISLGPAGSAIRAAGEALLGGLGWRRGDFEEIVDLTVDGQVEALCAARIDAFILPVSHPNGAVAAATACGAALVDVGAPTVERLTTEWPFYVPITIPGGLYRSVDDPVRSYGARATLVTVAATPEEAVYEVVKSAFEHLADLSRQHAALTGLEAKAMIASGNTAQFHEGALRYYRERGWK